MDPHELLNLARAAMRERGLEPEFPAAAQGEAAALVEPLAVPGAAAPTELRDAEV